MRRTSAAHLLLSMLYRSGEAVVHGILYKDIPVYRPASSGGSGIGDGADEAQLKKPLEDPAGAALGDAQDGTQVLGGEYGIRAVVVQGRQPQQIGGVDSQTVSKLGRGAVLVAVAQGLTVA